MQQHLLKPQRVGMRQDSGQQVPAPHGEPDLVTDVPAPDFQARIQFMAQADAAHVFADQYAPEKGFGDAARLRIGDSVSQTSDVIGQPSSVQSQMPPLSVVLGQRGAETGQMSLRRDLEGQAHRFQRAPSLVSSMVNPTAESLSRSASDSAYCLFSR